MAVISSRNRVHTIDQPDPEQRHGQRLALGRAGDPAAEDVTVGSPRTSARITNAQQGEGGDLDPARRAGAATADEHQHVGDEQGRRAHLTHVDAVEAGRPRLDAWNTPMSILPAVSTGPSVLGFVHSPARKATTPTTSRTHVGDRPSRACAATTAWAACRRRGTARTAPGTRCRRRPTRAPAAGRSPRPWRTSTMLAREQREPRVVERRHRMEDAQVAAHCRAAPRSQAANRKVTADRDQGLDRRGSRERRRRSPGEPRPSPTAPASPPGR